MKKLLFMLMTVGAVTASAVTVVALPPGTGYWQTIDTAGLAPTAPGETITSNVNNTPNSSAYWNNTTQDSSGSCLNIGCYLTTGAGPLASATAPVWIGHDDGTAVDDVYFAGTGSQSSQLLIEIAGHAAGNWVGWYRQGLDPLLTPFTTVNYNVDWGVIFDGAATASASASFNPTNNFGLWFLDNCSGACNGNSFNPLDALDRSSVGAQITANGYLSESTKNTGDARTGSSANDTQHFAFFAKSAAAGSTIPATYYVGIEDLKLNASDRDFNDMVLTMHIVPEPGYYVLLLAGMAGLYAFSRKRKTLSSEISK